MEFSLTILGTAGAVPAYGRFCSSQLLRFAGDAFLIDCGEGCQMRLQQYAPHTGRLRAVFISHLHGDHYFGLPGLLTSMSLNARTEPLQVFSPPGLREQLAPLIGIDRYDYPFDLQFVTIPGDREAVIFRTDELIVSTLPLNHGLPTAGFLFREQTRPANILPDKIRQYNIPYSVIADIKAGADFRLPDGRTIPHTELTRPAPPPRSYAYCSDTRYLPELAERVKGVDLLYHEATFLHERLAQAEETLHSTAREAGLIAREAGVDRLLLGHFSSRYPDPDVLAAEAREVFSRAEAAREGCTYDLPFAGRNLPD